MNIGTNQRMKTLVLVLGCFCLQIYAQKEQVTSETDTCKAFMRKSYRRYWSIQGPHNCLNQTYTFGHQIDKFHDECLVEPEDESLSFYDSTWIYYKCIVEKSMGSTPWTLSNYAGMMSSNLSDATRSAIFSVLHTDEAKPKMEVTTQATEIVPVTVETLRSYWNDYFEAEFQVCTNSSMNTCSESEKKHHRGIWIPERFCPTKSTPEIADENAWSQAKFSKCFKILKKRHVRTNTTFDAVNSALFSWCDRIAKGYLEPQDENIPIDFDRMFNKLIARKYYSKSVKKQAFNVFRKEFANKYSTYNESIAEATSVEEIVSYATKQLDTKLKNAGHVTGNMIFLKNADILNTVIKSKVVVRAHLCHFPEIKKHVYLFPKSQSTPKI